MGTTAAQPQITPQQANKFARDLIIANCPQMTQQIFSTTLNPSTTSNVVNVIPRMVGLAKGFWIHVQSTITATAGSGAALVPSNFAASNILSQIIFTDLQNNTRVQVPGWYLSFLNTAKMRRPYAMASTVAGMDSPIGYGSNWPVITQTPSIAFGTTGTVSMWYWVPLAYSDADYRGAVYLGVTNATANLQLTINPTPVTVSGDSTASVYTGNTGTNTNTTITVYQVWMDQLPMSRQGPILPMIDLSTIYDLKQTTFTAIVPNQDFPMQYANFRDFVSTTIVFYNGSARAAGSDINYWTLQSANFTNLWKKEPNLIALASRNLIGTDWPLGTYYFPTRDKPISTIQYGNMQTILNASTAGAGAYCMVGYEAFALQNTLTQAGSLPAS